MVSGADNTNAARHRSGSALGTEQTNATGTTSTPSPRRPRLALGAEKSNASETTSDPSPRSPGTVIATDQSEAVNATPSPAPGSLDAKIKEERERFAQEIFASYHQLSAILMKHEALIRFRWRVKSHAERISTLGGIRPCLPKEHRPDFSLYRNGVFTTADGQRTTSMFRALMLDITGGQARPETTDAMASILTMPMMNMEDLAHPEHILMLLHSRGRTEPYQFIYADAAQLARTGESRVSRLEDWENDPEGVVMLFHGRTEAHNYGELTNVMEAGTNEPGLPPSAGLQGLKIQVSILNVLVSFCLRVLHDLSPAELAGANMNHLWPNPGPLKLTPTEHARIPPEFEVNSRPNLRVIKVMVQAQRDASEKHLWSLCENPSYFAKTLIDHSEHLPERILDSNGNAHPGMEGDSKESKLWFWNRALSEMVRSAHLNIFSFRALLSSVIELETSFAALSTPFTPGMPLPAACMQQWVKVCLLVNALVEYYCATIWDAIRASPPLRGNFYHSNPSKKSTGMDTALKEATDELPDNSGVRILLRLLDGLDFKHQKKEHWLYSLYTWVDGMDYSIRTDERFKALITPFIANLVSTLKVVCQCIHRLEHFQPWAATVKKEMNRKKESQGGNLLYQSLFGPMLGIDFNDEPNLFICSPPFPECFRVSEGLFAESYAEAVRVAELNLDVILNGIDIYYKINVSGNGGKTLREILASRPDAFRNRMHSRLSSEPPKDKTSIAQHEDGCKSSQNSAPRDSSSSNTLPIRSASKAEASFEHEQSKAIGATARAAAHAVNYSSGSSSSKHAAQPTSKDKKTQGTKANKPMKNGVPILPTWADGSYLGPPSTNLKTSLPEPKRVKPKTPGVAASPEPDPRPPNPTTPPPQTARISVPPRHQDAFAMLFPIAGAAHRSGELAWVDFVHAMSLLGFEPETRDGSRYNFIHQPSGTPIPNGLGVEGTLSIQFHRPHNPPKIDANKARAWGRRLVDRYGYEPELFMFD